MIPQGNNKNNVERFSGFEDIYNMHRPEAPETVVWILKQYLRYRPSLVVDLGCGTGLSSFIWMGHADQVVGVEPNDDMRNKAQEKLRDLPHASRISFIQGYSNQLVMDAGSVDVVTCSQSFHWMEPTSTLKEVSRVLQEGGIFAAYDCDWPPTVHWEIEDQYNKLMEKTEAILARLVDKENQATKRDKNEHMKNIEDSKVFRFTKEIVFHNMEKCDAKRYIGLALSQGGVQTVLKLGSSELIEDIQRYQRKVNEFFGEKTLEVMFSYRMRLGLK